MIIPEAGWQSQRWRAQVTAAHIIHVQSRSAVLFSQTSPSSPVQGCQVVMALSMHVDKNVKNKTNTGLQFFRRELKTLSHNQYWYIMSNTAAA